MWPIRSRCTRMMACLVSCSEIPPGYPPKPKIVSPSTYSKPREQKYQDSIHQTNDQIDKNKDRNSLYHSSVHATLKHPWLGHQDPTRPKCNMKEKTQDKRYVKDGINSPRILFPFARLPFSPMYRTAKFTCHHNTWRNASRRKPAYTSTARPGEILAKSTRDLVLARRAIVDENLL